MEINYKYITHSSSPILEVHVCSNRVQAKLRKLREVSCMFNCDIFRSGAHRNARAFDDSSRTTDARIFVRAMTCIVCTVFCHSFRSNLDERM